MHGALAYSVVGLLVATVALWMFSDIRTSDPSGWRPSEVEIGHAAACGIFWPVALVVAAAYYVPTFAVRALRWAVLWYGRDARRWRRS